MFVKRFKKLELHFALIRMIHSQLFFYFVTGLWGSSTFASRELSNNNAKGAIKFFGDREVFACG